MKIRRSRLEDPDLNITPLIDVVFLLLIFFMVSTTFKRESEIVIELPEAESGEAREMQRQIEIAIDAEGRYYVNEHEVVNTKISTLMQAIKKVAGDNKEPVIIISGDAKAPHQSVMTVVDALQQLGFVHMTFATQKSSGE
jgi:biopolymer transport protein ExbD